ncbi:hypothetical protein DOTSEDRAFT_73298 [Dothistroma septosporum NZE10]|uniref:Uncharacterized protein n=1 Tax=Dothistroma septosporum (strain NZE10 / CBS 128990) TaxID=675120 RepID=N1PII4_DOTSN|nr:hypothetical protein DOTSEDRAFT_73298 [Dothistroma septosporum NZE10]
MVWQVQTLMRRLLHATGVRMGCSWQRRRHDELLLLQSRMAQLRSGFLPLEGHFVFRSRSWSSTLTP